MGDEQPVQDRLHLLYQLSAQMASFGPVLATKMSVLSTVSLPWGLGAAGAETVKQGVDSGNPEGIARLTAIMVKLGLLGTVHDIVVSLCSQKREDAVAAVTAGLLAQGEVVVVVRITNALIASGHTNEAVSISGQLISQGNTQIYKVISESGLPMNPLAGGGEGAAEQVKQGWQSATAAAQQHIGGAVGAVQEKTAQVVDSITSNDNTDARGTSDREDDGGQEQSTVDADALFSEWTGVKAGTKPAASPAKEPAASRSDAHQPVDASAKEERLL